MARYIDADKFLKSMIAKFKCVPLLGVSKYINGEECFEGEHLDSLINEAPTADVEEVVYCKDCEWSVKRVTNNEIFPYQCLNTTACGKPRRVIDFCSYGERSDTNG